MSGDQGGGGQIVKTHRTTSSTLDSKSLPGSFRAPLALSPAVEELQTALSPPTGAGGESDRETGGAP